MEAEGHRCYILVLLAHLLLLWVYLIVAVGRRADESVIVLQMFIAVINENFEIAEEQKRKRQVEEFIRRGEPQSAHVSWIDRLNPYRLVKARHQAVQVRSLPQNLVLPLKQTVGADVGQAAPSSAMNGFEVPKQKLRKLFGREKDDSVLRYRKRPVSAVVKPDAYADDYADDRGL